MPKQYAVLLFFLLHAVGCGSQSGTAQLETYPAVTPDEQAVIDQNIESLKDEVR